MKKLLVLSLVLLLGVTCMAKTAFFDNLYIKGDVTVEGTVTFADLDIVGDLGLTGNADFNGATMLFDGSTSVRNVSAGFTSNEAPAVRIGSDIYTYMTIAVTATTGNVAITQSGSTTAMSWTAAGGFDLVGAIELDATTIVGNLDVNGTTAIIDGSTSVRNVSAGFTSNEAPAIRFGPDIYTYLTMAVTSGTGDVAITQSGSNTAMIWTASGGFDLVGPIALDSITASGTFLYTGNTTQTGSITLLGANGDLTVGDDADVTGDLSVDGTANLDNTDIDGTLDVAGTTALLTCSTSVINYTPIFTFGYDVGAAMTFTTTDTTGAVDITMAGSGTALTWAADSMTLTTAFEIVGASIFDSITAAGGFLYTGNVYQTGSYSIIGNTLQTGSITLLGSGGDLTVGDDANVTGDLDVDGIANFDIVDIDDAVNIASTVTHIGDYLQTGSFLITGNTTQTGSITLLGSGGDITVGDDATIIGDLDVDGIANLDVTDIDDTLNVQGITTFQANTTVATATNAGGIYVSQYALTYVQSASTTICTLPADVDVVDVVVVVQTGFNDSGTDLFDLGWSGTLEGYVQNLPVQTASVLRAGDSGMLYANLGDVGGATRDLLGIYTGQNSDSSAGALSIYVYWTLGVPGAP